MLSTTHVQHCSLLEGRHLASLELFKAAGLAHPVTLHKLFSEGGRDAVDERIELLRGVHRFDDDGLINALKREMHGAAACGELPAQPRLLDEARRRARAGGMFQPGDQCFVRRLVRAGQQQRVGTPELAVVLQPGYRTPGEQHTKYSVRYQSDSAVEAVEQPLMERAPMDVLYFFWCFRHKFPRWYDVVCVMALLHPTSAAAERVFSQLQAFFAGNGRRSACLSDLVNTTLKLRVNDRQL